MKGIAAAIIVAMAATLSRAADPTPRLPDLVSARTSTNIAVRSGVPGTNHTRTPIVLGLSRIAGESSQNAQGVMDSLADATATYGRAPGSFTIWCNFGAGGNPIATFPTAILNHPRWPAATMPVIGWALHGVGDSDGRYSNHAIINNAATPVSPAGWHHYITTWAQAAAGYNKPVIVRLAHEMNMAWVPWAVGKHAGTIYGGSGNTFANYRQMWQTVYGLVHPIAPKVKFFWCPWDVADPGNTGKYADFYPGDACVDYIGFDSYVWTGNVRQAMEEQFNPSLNALHNLSPGSTRKPVIIGELGRAPGGPDGARVSWLRDGYRQLYALHPNVKGIIYFDIDARFLGHPDWRLSADPSLVPTYKDLVALPQFQGAY